jgi:hypothetical protein
MRASTSCLSAKPEKTPVLETWIKSLDCAVSIEATCPATLPTQEIKATGRSNRKTERIGVLTRIVKTAPTTFA